MAFELRELSGSLFRNNKREKETHPQMTGECLIGGVAYWVSAWTKEDKNGNKFQSLAFKPKEEKSAKKPDSGMPGDMDNDLPF